ncbi:hypothetical protein [Bradyrhizobium sp. DASA03120]|uniref:hypothetical protein n=1 Tax=Bradyrhizobium sp. SMVTL-02 TaxID=3395917 RepID=UPI003F71EA68
MRNGVGTALVALLALIGDVRHPAAQFAPFLPPAPQTLAPTATPPAEQTRAAPHRRSKAHRKREVVRPPANQRKVAETNGYRRVSDLVNFPKFFPGLGIIFVKPDTLPLGPFLCFDRRDRLVATVYMVPIKDIDDHKSLDGAGSATPVDHVSLYFNPGHPGVDVPHYHVVLWHVTRKQEARVAK